MLPAVVLFALLSAPALSADGPALPPGLEDETQSAAPAPSGPALPEGLEAGDGDTSAASPAPALPEGLGGEGTGPSLPPGLEGGTGPSLPPGLEDATEDETEAAPGDEDEVADAFDWFEFSGFWDTRGGVRTQEDPHEKCASLGETRLQLDAEARWENVSAQVVADFLYDAVDDDCELDLNTGDGWIDLRQAWLAFTPLNFLDVKVGRQILTWGTGDLLFVNDLFPKDWQSFFLGRDVEYLKAPSDALKVSAFSEFANVDLVYTPQFDPDRYITGRRISYWNSTLQRRAGRDAIVEVDRPDDWFKDDEWALRVSRNVGSVELAAYGYWGFWKSPAGRTRSGLRASFPPLSVYGASVRGPLWGGIANAEAAWYDSRDDRDGDDPLINNSEARLLVGYERDLSQLARDLKVGLQYYVEILADHDAYLRTLPQPVRDEARAACRHVLTFRVTQLLLNQNLTLSLFAYYSPSDSDAYLRPSASYKIDDHWTVEGGANVFFGAHDYTFFGQFERNSNVYAAVRYGF